MFNKSVFREIWQLNLMVFLVLGLMTILFNIIQIIPLLISKGFSLENFMKLVLYNIPQLATLLLPLTTAGSVLVVFRRLNMENELTAMSMAGVSPRHLLMPIYATAFVLFLIIIILKFSINPISKQLYAEERTNLQNELINNFLTEGKFFSPVDGLTFFIGKKTGANTISQVFVVDKRKSEKIEQIISAEKGVLLNDNNRVTLHLLNGSQHIKENGKTNYLNFTRYIFDLTNLKKPEDRFIKAGERDIFELLDIIQTKNDSFYTSKQYQTFIAEIFERFTFPILSIAVVLIPCVLLVKPRIYRRKKIAYSTIFATLSTIFLLISYFIIFGFAKQSNFAVAGMGILAFGAIIMSEIILWFESRNYRF